MHCKKNYCFYCQSNDCSSWMNIINNMRQYVNVRKSHLMHVFYAIHTLTAWLDHEEVRTNQNIFDENSL